MTVISPSAKLDAAFLRINRSIIDQLGSRGFRAANELRNASQLVLRGQRHGRRYRIPNTKQYYTASAPGEPPAVRTGNFRRSWQRKSEVIKKGERSATIRPYIYNNVMVKGRYLGDILEKGNGKIAPRPHHDRIREKALPSIRKIYKEPYFR